MYIYNALEIMLKGNVKGKVLFERLIFAPLFMVLTLYILERLKVGFSFSLYAHPSLWHTEFQMNCYPFFLGF